MAQFISPFVGNLPARKMNNDELIRAIRMDLSAEQEAIHLYTAHAEATDNAVAKRALNEVAGDEKTHSGVFLRLIEALTGDEGEYMLEGASEFDKETASIRSPINTSPQFNVNDPLGLFEAARVRINAKIKSVVASLP